MAITSCSSQLALAASVLLLGLAVAKGAYCFPPRKGSWQYAIRCPAGQHKRSVMTE